MESGKLEKGLPCSAMSSAAQYCVVVDFQLEVAGGRHKRHNEDRRSVVEGPKRFSGIETQQFDTTGKFSFNFENGPRFYLDKILENE